MESVKWYVSPMQVISRSPVKYYIGAGAAAAFLCIAHVVHDFLEGDDPLLPSVWVSLSIVSQIMILSFGYGRAVRKKWSRRKSVISAVLVSIVCGWLTVWLHSPIDPTTEGLEKFWFSLAGFSVLGFWFLVFYFPKQMDDALKRVFIAESARAEAELAKLRSNLHPHFLLNTLNAVSGLTTADPKQARRLISLLGDLLRDSLEDGDEMISFEAEIEWLRRYAEIFEIRFGDRISFEWDIAETSKDILIPRLLLQPLIENAIEHGALRATEGGAVVVRSDVSENSIRISVRDNGPGLAADTEPGLGLRLVRERLFNAFKEAAMVIEPSNGGCLVTLTIPRMPERSRPS